MLDVSLVRACGAADDGLVSLRGTLISWIGSGASIVGAALGVRTRGGAGVGIGTIGSCGGETGLFSFATHLVDDEIVDEGRDVQGTGCGILVSTAC